MSEDIRDDNEYEVSLPYPEPKVEDKNRQYARLLLESYAGRISELTSVLQYTYNAIVLNKEYSEVAEIMRKIADVDKKHLDLLGETILLLGIRPRYWDSRRRYWRSDNIDYSTKIDDLLARCIVNERLLIRQYNQQRRQIKDRYVDALLQRIIIDDRLHRRTCRRLYRRYVGPIPSNLGDESNEMDD